MNDKINSQDHDLLDSLFEQARATQPVLEDAGFASSVMSALPTAQANPHSLADYTSGSKRFNWYDALGLGVGLVACFSVIEPSQLITMANNILPDRVVLSPLTLLSASLAMAALAFTGWQALEGDLRH